MLKMKWLVVAFIFGSLSAHALPTKSGYDENPRVLNIGIIGGGPAGLTSAKNALEQGHNVEILEKNGEFSGTWYYTDKTGNDEYGVPIHTAMYQNLRVNVPYQSMEFMGHHYPKNTQSYPTQEVVLQYLHSYADRFGLKKYIKYRHLVEKVVPIENNMWSITVRDFPNNKTETKVYDAVFVCINMYSSPNNIQMEGADQFKGKIMHSHDYRKPEAFRGEEVLVVGGGPSGLDLVLHLAKIVNRLTLSTRHNNIYLESIKEGFGGNVTIKGEVTRLTPYGAEFIDGSQQNFTVVFFATGYKYEYPFLGADTGIEVENGYVQPLYKQILNIEHPSMAFIGVPLFGVNNFVFDLQARFALKFISGAKELPSKSEMLEDTDTFAKAQSEEDAPKRKSHFVSAEKYKSYYEAVALTADVEKIPSVNADIFTDGLKSFMKDHLGFRKNKYTIIDDKTYIKEKEE